VTSLSPWSGEGPVAFPVLALRDLVFFPSLVLPLLVGRPRSTGALEAAVHSEDLLVLVSQKDPETEDPSPDQLHRVGTLTRVVQRSVLPDQTVRVVFEGLERVRVHRFLPELSGSGHPPLHAEFEPLPYPTPDPDQVSEVEAGVRRVEREAREYAHLHPELADAPQGAGLDDPSVGRGPRSHPARIRSLHRIAGHLLLPAEEKQRVLEAETVEATASLLLELLERELEILRIEERLDREMSRQMDKERRHIYLQEQLRVIQKELGSDGGEWDDLESRLAGVDLPDEVGARARRELDRLRRLSPSSPESGVIRNYLDWIFSLPWTRRTRDNAEVEHAREVLEEAHYGLDEVKDRILDHIAVLSLVGELRGPVLCLVGPPGVGKTSLGRSIARALERSFVRVSLGGIRDEAEIRGHRRTYVGSLPGRVIQGLRQAGSANPVFLLDEVDKVARDGHGDPAAALLEVLDPEQNRSFRDHFLELEVDLSGALFIATANTLAGIPGALRDRMEVIRIPGYLDTEKRVIAHRFLLPAQLRDHGLEPERLRLTDQAVDRVIEGFTREAGVRELDRCLARIARKVARGVADGTRDRVGAETLHPEELEGLLGPPPHRRDPGTDSEDRVGIATGLAWTQVGGDTLEVEVAVVPGSGSIQLTGTLGDVMKESAVAAFTFARARARLLGLRPGFHREVDIHIHIPEGATPKDGPSAGVTIAAALVSALTGLPTRPRVAMTGEITLRGRVLPVGGIREKVVAAHRTGMTTVVLPAGNAAVLERLPAEVTRRLEFCLVDRMDQVLDEVFGREMTLPGSKRVGDPEHPGGPLDGALRISQ
jgi:ATP-dependent Lon protease